MPAGLVPGDAAAPAPVRSRFLQRETDAIGAPSAYPGFVRRLEVRVLRMGLSEGMRPFQHGATAFAAPDFQIVDADVALFVERRHQESTAVGRKDWHAVQRGAAPTLAVDQQEDAAFIIE